MPRAGPDAGRRPVSGILRALVVDRDKQSEAPCCASDWIFIDEKRKTRSLQNEAVPAELWRAPLHWLKDHFTHLVFEKDAVEVR